MKKLKFLLVSICILIFQVKVSAQDNSAFFDFFEIDPEAVEMVNLRTEMSKTFSNPNSSRTTLIFNIPIHELDVNDYWENIFSDLDDLISYDQKVIYIGKTWNGFSYWYTPDIGFQLGSQASFPSIYRTFIRWNTSVIPDGTTIIESRLGFNYGSGTNDIDYEVREMEDDPGNTHVMTEAEAQLVYDDCGDGQIFVEIDHPGSLTNNANFEDALQSRLTEDWMAVGLKMVAEQGQYLIGADVSGLALTWNSSLSRNMAVTYNFNPSIFPSIGSSYPITITNVGVSGTIEFEVDIDYDPGSGSGWLSASPTTGTSNQGQNVTYISSTTNNTGNPRSATVTITATSPSNVLNPVKEIYITQPPNIPKTLYVCTDNTNYPSNCTNPISISGIGGQHNVNVTNIAGSDPINYIVEENETWVSINPSTNSTPNGFTITALPNFLGNPRGTVVKVSSTPTQVAGSPKYITITQNPATTLTLPDQEIEGQTSYLVPDWIVVNSFIVGSGGDVNSLTLGAGNKITLNPGFVASGTFRAYIHDFGIEPDNLEGNNQNQEKESKVLSIKGKGESIEGDNTPEQIPTEYDLFQNYPNPFNPTTNIKFALPERSYVNLAVYNLIGQKVAELTNNELEAGYHSIQFNGSMLSSGLYFYRITTNKFSKTYKMLLVK